MKARTSFELAWTPRLGHSVRRWGSRTPRNTTVPCVDRRGSP